jgi:hypothetical protein
MKTFSVAIFGFCMGIYACELQVCICCNLIINKTVLLIFKYLHSWCYQLCHFPFPFFIPSIICVVSFVFFHLNLLFCPSFYLYLVMQTHYALLLCSFKDQLQQHVRVHAMEAVMACWELEQSLQSLTGI